MCIKVAETYANVFDVKVLDKYVSAKLSTARKDKDGNLVNSSWNAKFIGDKNREAAGELKNKDRIKIKSANISNESYTDKNGDNKYFVSVTVFEFELLVHSDKKKDSSSEKPKKPAEEPKVDEDDSPL